MVVVGLWAGHLCVVAVAPLVEGDPGTAPLHEGVDWCRCWAAGGTVLEGRSHQQKEGRHLVNWGKMEYRPLSCHIAEMGWGMVLPMTELKEDLMNLN